MSNLLLWRHIKLVPVYQDRILVYFHVGLPVYILFTYIVPKCLDIVYLLIVFQHGISCMYWDPTGQLLATCAGEMHLKVWSHSEDSWMCRHDMIHESAVTIMQWCSIVGKKESPRLMLARYKCIVANVSCINIPYPVK